jgi:SEC-C motif-containing protein
VKVGRNDACPCGSGRKVKRCCGVDGIRARMRRTDDAVEELFGLASLFPRYRPASPSFDDWALTAPDELSREALGEGVAHLDAEERERIVGGFRGEYPELWSGVLHDFGDEALAINIVLAGAVVAGLWERRLPHDETSLEILEHDPEARADPVEALALTLDCHDLWSVIESGRAAEAVDNAPGRKMDRVLAAEAERLTTDWHRERLRVLVRRLREQLPEPAYPRASAALLRACERLLSDEALARRLRVELLLDSLPRLLLAAAA